MQTDVDDFFDREIETLCQTPRSNTADRLRGRDRDKVRDPQQRLLVNTLL